MASTYPILKIAGVDLNDPSGRWDVLPGTTLLPAFPGRVETKVSTPGVPGYRAVAYAPGEPIKVAINMRFNAVSGVGNRIIPGNGAERAAAIAANMDMFFYATALARQGYAGLVRITKELKAGEVRMLSARMVASTEPDFNMGNDYATLQMVFEAPGGIWQDQNFSIFRTTTVANKTITVEIPAGTAPALENVIAFRGAYSKNTSDSNRIKFTNEIDVGFQVGFLGANVNMAANDWMLINCLTWKNGYQRGLSGNFPNLSWGTGKNQSQIHPVGRPLGNALTLLPSTKQGVAKLRIYSPMARQVQVRTRRAWY